MKKDFKKDWGTEGDLGKQISHRTSEYEVPFTKTTEEALKLFKSRITQEKPEKKQRLMTPYFYWSAAASVILVAVWLIWLRNPPVNVIAEKGIQKEIALPDNSVVSINADSRISYDKRNFNDKRYIQMDGEAFFSVKKGSTFTVRTPYGEIKVLGTTFNVQARKNLFKVSCLTGSVKVSSGTQSLVLSPGESCIFENSSLKKYEDSNIDHVSKWRNGEFYFDNASLKLVFEEIARQFNVTFVSENIENRNFSGSFSNDNLTDALDIVCIPMGLKYEIDSDRKIHIRQKVR